MVDYVEAWTRSNPTTSDRVAEVDLVVFAEGELADDEPLVASRYGIPSRAAYEALDVRVIGRDANADWFDNWRTDGMRAVAEHCLGEDVADLDRADCCYVIRTAVEEPADLGHLQAAWAMARWLIARGGGCVLDVHAGQFHTTTAVSAVPPDAALDPIREISLIYETEESAPGAGHLVHTRGMRKFGRPDLVARVDEEDAGVMAQVLRQVSAAMADGWLPAERHGVDLLAGRTLYLVPYEPADDLPDVHLNNDGMQLVEEDGSRPRGLAAIGDA